MKLLRSPLPAAIAAAATAVATLAGCGSDGETTGSSGEETIKVMTWASLANPKISLPQVKTAAEARVKAINDAGGIKGHRVELIFCDTNYDPNTEAGCARQAQQEKVAAVVGAHTTFPGTFAVLERAKVPFVGSLGLTEQEMASPVVYPLAGGVPGWYAGAVAQLKQAGGTTIGMIACNSPACTYATKVIKDSVPRSGMKLIAEASVASGVSDPSAGVAQAIAGNPDGLIVAVPPNDIPKLVQAVRRAGYKGKISSSTSLFPAGTIKALGADAEGILLTSQVRPLSQSDDPAIAQFDKEMDAIDPAVKKDENAELVWGAYVLFQKVAERLDSVGTESVSTAMSNLSEPVETGITSPYTTTGKTAPMANTPRLFNPTVFNTEIKNGALVVTSDTPIDPFNALTDGS
ncbi:ABC transporter substrate-binding protein [Microbispora sp. CA-102843]|uniref:ABC transporter substrate-binding protein n=1 Tax=Microbispora sp. CA-102843 TaxID=3239952 RepID=UPI003D8D5862